ncbi:MAG TPA: pirin family protein [Bacteroidia bacterium]
MNKKVKYSGRPGISRSMGPHVRQVIPSVVEHIEPFVFLDHFGPFSKPAGSDGVPPHPHAGIATLTYLIEGSNRHRDSLGNEALVEQGDLALMIAGKGIVHAEGLSTESDVPKDIHGLQFWISLPAKDKFMDPAFYLYRSSDFPIVLKDGYEIKVIIGDLNGNHSSVITPSPAFLYEVKVKSGQSLSVPIPAGFTAGIYLISGEINIDQKSFKDIQMIDFEAEGDTIEILAQSDAHLMLMGGEPLNEPIVAYASFVMNSKEQIIQVLHDYEDGKMGHIK